MSRPYERPGASSSKRTERGHNVQDGRKPKRSGGSARHDDSENRLPGASKIKASIRQTTRLLAKDSLEPGLRVQTERRLAALKADLAKVEQSKVEQKFGKKYHMVKFFERQKLMRIIKRIKRELEAAEESQEDAVSVASGKKGKSAASPRERLEQELEDARVMLNYVITYPYNEKYIAIFPARADLSQPESEESQATATLPPLLTSEMIEKAGAAGGDKTSSKRLAKLLSIRESMRAAVSAGQEQRDGVNVKPEEAERQQKKARRTAAAGAGVSASGEVEVNKDGKKELEEEDDFFGGDDDDDDEE